MTEEIKKKKFIEFEGKLIPIKIEPEELQRTETSKKGRKRTELVFKRNGLRMIQRLAQFYKTEYNLSFDQEEEKLNGLLCFPSFNITIKSSDRTKRGNLRKLAYQLHEEYVKRIKKFEEINQNKISYI